LGYPPCCCTAIATAGESAIDDCAAIAADWNYSGCYRMINPAAYRAGGSLICHVPCSPTCDASLSLATRAWSVARQNLHRPRFSLWRLWQTLL
jgi:hypothetical protein